MSFSIQGRLVVLCPIVEKDIADYERWNHPDSRALHCDGPWYNEDLSRLIAGRGKRLPRGYGPPYHTLEAFSLWTDYLFRELSLTRIGFTTWQGNPAMLAIGSRLGFVEEGRRRKSCLVRGEFYDRVLMGILRNEWEENKERTRP